MKKIEMTGKRYGKLTVLNQIQGWPKLCCKDCNYAKGNRYTYAEWTAMATALKRTREID
jgi:hypothetical protein